MTPRVRAWNDGVLAEQLGFPGELIVDSFAGGGGASLGMELALGRSPDIAMCGNSVCPPLAAAIVAANANPATFAPGFGQERVA